MENETQEAKDFDTIADELLNKVENETPADSSSATKQEGDQIQDDQTSGAEPVKTEQVKAVENDRTLSVEERIAKIKEILGDDEKAIDAYIKQKGYHNDPAWQKQRELIDKIKKEAEEKSALSKEDKEALEEFKKFRSTAEYIREKMKTEGYTQEAINRKLEESGFKVQSDAKDDFELITSKLGIDPGSITDENKSLISDAAQIARIVVADALEKYMPRELEPLKNHVEQTKKNENAIKLTTQMRTFTKNEGILDFDKDVQPLIHKFMDENQNCTQQDVYDHFKDLSHKLTIERLKSGKKHEERQDKKNTLRQNVPFSNSRPSAIKRTGDFNADADAFLDSVNLND